jgi:hypothetical protein
MIARWWRRRKSLTWVTADRRRIKVCDMETSHLRNTIAMMRHEVPRHYLDAERRAMPIYNVMVAELQARRGWCRCR